MENLDCLRYDKKKKKQGKGASGAFLHELIKTAVKVVVELLKATDTTVISFSSLVRFSLGLLMNE